MKKMKIIFTMLSLCLCFRVGSIPLLVAAAESNPSVPVTNEEYMTCPYDGHIYGEIVNGLFARTMTKEMENVPKDAPDYFTEYEKAQKSHRIGYLTPEMEAAGYLLQASNGYVYTPDEREGDAGEGALVEKITGSAVSDGIEIESYDENGNPTVDWNKGYVSFISKVHPDIHEVCFVEVTNINSSKTYSFELYEQNGFNKGIQLPAGSYTVSGGGIREDYTNQYPINNPAFEVVAGSPTVVNITIGNIDESAIQTGVTVEINQDVEPEVEKTEPETQKSSFSLIRLVVYLLIGAGGIFLIRKYIRKK